MAQHEDEVLPHGPGTRRAARMDGAPSPPLEVGGTAQGPRVRAGASSTKQRVSSAYRQDALGSRGHEGEAGKPRRVVAQRLDEVGFELTWGTHRG